MTQKTLLLFLCSFLTQALGPAKAYSRDYYISFAGSDSNPGTQSEPWRTIAKVNDTDFRPGDQLHFQGGKRFAGTIELDSNDSGASDMKLILTSYGVGRAVIDGRNGNGLRANGCNYLVVRNLNFAGSGRKGGNTQDGVSVLNVQGLEIDRVEVSGFRGGGLSADGVCDARITNVYAHENGAAGLSVGYSMRSKNLYIAHCVARNNPGDPSNLTNHSGNGIVVANAQEVVVEYCEADNNGWDMPRKGNGPVGIWAWNSDRVIIQFCISHDNKSPGDDGGGFDLDGGITNSILQYNLSYNNDGPGYFLCQFPSAGVFKDNIIRYNISHNDGVKNNRRSAIDVYSANSSASDCQVYNNTIYNKCGAAVGFGGLPMPGVVFQNNIFFCSGDVIAGDAQRGRFENNVYWSADGQKLSFDGYDSLGAWAEATGHEKAAGKVVGRFIDPKLVGAGDELPADPNKLCEMVAYKLRSDSICLDTGIPIRNNGGRDFWGNPVPESERPAVGAFNPAPVRQGLMFDARGIGAVGAESGQDIQPETLVQFRQNTVVKSPALWSIEPPVLYTDVIEVQAMFLDSCFSFYLPR